MAFTQVTVYGHRDDPDGTPASGILVFVPSVAMRSSTGITETVAASRVVGRLNSSGDFSVTLTATDDPATTPLGNAYLVTEYLAGQDQRRYYLPVPSSSNSLDIDVAPIFEDLPGAITMPVPGAQGVSVTSVTINGSGRQIVTLSDGSTIDAGMARGPQGLQGVQGEPGLDGSGQVDSVNDQVGTVILGADDVGAAPVTHTHGVSGLTATGTPNTTTFLRGDNTWATPATGGGGVGGVPDDGSVTNAKVAAGAAINADKLANGTTNVIMLAVERTKLATIAVGATANSTDATLLARANHTGTQAISTVTGLQTALDTITGNTQAVTAYTLVLADAGRAVEMNNAAANTLTIPPNSSVAFPVGTVIEVLQLGAGQTTIAAGAGVTLRAPDGAKLAKQYASASLRQRAANEWILAGSTLT